MLDKIFFKQWRAKLTRLSPARRIFLSFALVILMGSLLLSLPFVQQVSSTAGYIDHLFTAVSMVCVTGPVSYTHLDVYKRQDLKDFTATFLSQQTLLNVLINYSVFDTKDVYKRQIL